MAEELQRGCRRQFFNQHDFLGVVCKACHAYAACEENFKVGTINEHESHDVSEIYLIVGYQVFYIAKCKQYVSVQLSNLDHQ